MAKRTTRRTYRSRRLNALDQLGARRHASICVPDGHRKAHPTRESWLDAAAVVILDTLWAAELKELGKATPKIATSCGWPLGAKPGSSREILGQCWAANASEKHRHEIFVSPRLAKPAEVLGVLAHELVHAIDGNQNGHRRPFKRLCDRLGLEGKPTSAFPGDELAGKLKLLATALGPYPHGTMNARPNGKKKKQSTRLVKCACIACGYTCRTTRKWLDDAGAPLCPCNGEPMMAEDPEEDE